jgi:3-oxoacyl-[acyl-carrier protein] reductase
MRLDQRVAVITGGANGIGRATGIRFAQEGATVVVWDLDEQAGAEVVNDVTNNGGQARFQMVNVADEESVNGAVLQVLEAFSRIDILVNNAGILRDAQLVKVKDRQGDAFMSTEDFEAVIGVNLRGVFFCTRAVVPTMIEQGYGRIINASSVVGLYGNFGQTNYVASKAGVIGMTRVWARELGRYNITVNAIAPGFISTDMVKGMPEKVLNRMLSRTPLRRFGSPEEVANAYLFLASDEAAFITGAVISVDGGLVVGT